MGSSSALVAELLFFVLSVSLFLFECLIIHERISELSDPDHRASLLMTVDISPNIDLDMKPFFIGLDKFDNLVQIESVRVYDNPCNSPSSPDERALCLSSQNNLLSGYNPKDSFDQTFIKRAAHSRFGLSSTAKRLKARPSLAHGLVTSCSFTFFSGADFFGCYADDKYLIWMDSPESRESLRLFFIELNLVYIVDQAETHWNNFDKGRKPSYEDYLMDANFNINDGLECDILSTSNHDLSYCSFPYCNDVVHYNTCSLIASHRRNKRQWDVASFIIATGAATLAGFNRVEIEHLKTQISSMLEASKEHEKAIIGMGNKVAAITREVNRDLHNVHSDIEALAYSTKQKIKELSTQMGSFFLAKTSMDKRLQTMDRIMDRIAGLVLAEIQNRLGMFYNLANAITISNHEQRLQRLITSIKAGHFSSDFIGFDSLYGRATDKEFLDKIRKMGCEPLLSGVDLYNYLKDPWFAVQLINATHLQVMVEIPVKKTHNPIVLYKIHCLEEIIQSYKFTQMMQVRCPDHPTYIAYPRNESLIYKINDFSRSGCKVGKVAICSQFIQSYPYNPKTEDAKCVTDSRGKTGLPFSPQIHDSCEVQLKTATANHSLVILDNGKIFLSNMDTNASGVFSDGSSIMIPRKTLLALENRCLSRITFSDGVYHVPSLMCSNDATLLISTLNVHEDIALSRYTTPLFNNDISISTSKIIEFLVKTHSNLTEEEYKSGVDVSMFMKIIKDSEEQDTNRSSGLDEQLQNLDKIMREYKKKVDDLHSSIADSRSFVFWLALIGTVGTGFLILDVLVAALLGQTICGMIARYRRGECILRKKYGPPTEVTPEVIPLKTDAFWNATEILVHVDRRTNGSSRKNRFRKEIFIIIHRVFLKTTELHALKGLSVKIASGDSIDTVDVVRLLFARLSDYFGRRKIWIERFLDNEIDSTIIEANEWKDAPKRLEGVSSLYQEGDIITVKEVSLISI